MFLRSIGLKYADGPHKLVGPSINDTRELSFYIDDTHISLQVPKHKSRLRIPQRNPARHYHTESIRFPPMYPNARGGWDALRCISSACDFYGPIFTYALGTLDVNLSIFKPYKPDENISFFRPRSFEFTIAEIMTLAYGEDFGLNGQTWLAPEDWQPITRFQTICALFQEGRIIGPPERIFRLMMPISDKHLLSLSVTLIWNHVDIHKGGPKKSDDVHDISAMKQLCSDIMDSLQVKLSDEALAKQAEALNGLEDTSLVAEYPPLKWDPKHD